MELIKIVSKHTSSATSVAPTLAKRFEEPKSAADAGGEPITRGSERLFSLDFLRGADIFYLTVVVGVLRAINSCCPLPSCITSQLVHPEWVGFTVHDLIMPLFMFMCGAALPLALPRRLEDGHAGFAYWGHVFKRVAMLWILGMIAQGELFTFDLHRISFFNNTLQAIAVGYLVTAVVALIPSRVVQISITFMLAAGYTAFLHLCGDMTPTGNAAVVYEVKLLSHFYPHVSWHPVNQILALHYTWWTTIPMFGVMGLAGYHATGILMVRKWDKQRRASVLMLVGMGLVALGAAMAFTFDPCIKHIFTASFTAIAVGVSFFLYSACYTVFDIRRFRLGTGLISLFGRHSLLAYMLSGAFCGLLLVLPTAIVPGLSRLVTPGQAKLVTMVLQYGSLIAALWVWDGYKTGRRLLATAEFAAKKR